MADRIQSPTLSAVRFGRYVVVAFDRASPTDKDWSTLLEWYKPVPPARVLIYTEGGVPNAAQRVKLREALAGRNDHFAAGISASRLARAVGTAVSWFVPTLRTFAPNEVEEALEHLGADPHDRVRLKSVLQELIAERVGMQAKAGVAI